MRDEHQRSRPPPRDLEHLQARLRVPVMRMHDSPLVETWALPSDLPPFGVGEQPVPPVYAAVANAVFAATGKRIRELPIQGSALRENQPA
jgi:CO/xanthine dehydrogenase Mo-binding subunit